MYEKKNSTVWEREIVRLKAENSALRDNLKEAERNLSGARSLLEELNRQYQELKEQYESYLYDYSEKIESMEEARIAYEEKTKTLHTLMMQYTLEADQWISAIKKQAGKAV